MKLRQIMPGICALSLSPLLMQCASYSSFQTAKTMAPGKTALSVGFGANYLSDLSYLDLGCRTGIADHTDIGVKINYTALGSSLVMLDLKREIPSNLPHFNSAIGVGISPVFLSDLGIAVHLPAYFSWAFSGNICTIYANPRILYYLDLAFQEEGVPSNTGPGTGSSFGLKIGRDVSIMPEYSVLLGKYEGNLKVNSLFSVGIGIPIH